MGDFKERDLHNLLSAGNCLYDVAVLMRNYCKGRKTVVFLPLVDTAKEMAATLNDVGSDLGFRAVSVDGKDPYRDDKLQRFYTGEFNIICCSTLLTEGWDCPSVDCVVVLRPTRSRSLYQQMVGRGTRLCKGKTELLLLDFLWLSKKYDICGPASLLSRDGTDIDEKAINETIEKDGGDDLLIAEQKASDAKEARRKALQSELKENSRNREEVVWLTDDGRFTPDLSERKVPEEDKKGRKLLSMEEYANLIDDSSLKKELNRCRKDQNTPTQNQINALSSFGISAKGVTKKQASVLLDCAISRADNGKTSVWQIRRLQAAGFSNVNQWEFCEASRMITRIRKCGWAVPKNINPASYIPPSIKEWDDIENMEF